MQIRQAQLEDADECNNLFLADDEEYWSLRDFKSSSDNPDIIFLVAEENEGIIGYILGFIVPTKRDEVALHETRVHRNSRGKGVGVALVNEFCRHAFEIGAKVVYALIEPALMKFYGDACRFERNADWIEVIRKQ